MSSERVYCENFHGVAGKPDCCSSCHEDADMGWDSLGDCVMKDGREFIGCCVMRQWVESATLQEGV